MELVTSKNEPEYSAWQCSPELKDRDRNTAPCNDSKEECCAYTTMPLELLFRMGRARIRRVVKGISRWSAGK